LHGRRRELISFTLPVYRLRRAVDRRRNLWRPAYRSGDGPPRPRKEALVTRTFRERRGQKLNVMNHSATTVQATNAAARMSTMT
jgi:hypothetical protein